MKRFFMLMGLSVVLFILVYPKSGFPQEVDKNYFPTPNTVYGAKPDPKKQKDKEPVIRFIIMKNTQGTLAGNRCFEEATTKMGFQYLAVPIGQPPNKNGFSRWKYNFGVKFMILLKNGPFWKLKVNKKYKECKYGSGDFIG